MRVLPLSRLPSWFELGGNAVLGALQCVAMRRDGKSMAHPRARNANGAVSTWMHPVLLLSCCS